MAKNKIPLNELLNEAERALHANGRKSVLVTSGDPVDNFVLTNALTQRGIPFEIGTRRHTVEEYNIDLSHVDLQY